MKKEKILPHEEIFYIDDNFNIASDWLPHDYCICWKRHQIFMFESLTMKFELKYNQTNSSIFDNPWVFDLYFNEVHNIFYDVYVSHFIQFVKN